jgi:hypothetical protein
MKALSALVFACPAWCFAQSLDSGTYDVYFQQLSRDGQLDGCSLVFTALANDTAYLRGEQIVMNGSLAIRTLSGEDLAFTGKLGTRQLLASSPKWDAPAHFYFSTRNGSTAGIAKVIESDTEGYRLLIGRATDDGFMRMLKDMAGTGEFTVGFNRKPGGQDVYSSIKMNVALTKDSNGVASRITNDETPRDFFKCMSRLAAKLSDRLGGKR